MHLNHLNLCVDDLTEARAFFERSFDFQTVDQRGKALVVMTDTQGFTLVLSDPKAFGGASPRYPEGFHVGFIVETRAHVDRTYERLASVGIETSAPKSLHGSYTFYFTALDGILFEVSCPLPSAPE